jgi:hypothetical protein
MKAKKEQTQEDLKLQKELEERTPGIKVFSCNGKQWFDLSQARLKGGHHRYREYERLSEDFENECKKT